MKPKVIVVRPGGRPKPPLCPWLIDNPDAPPRHS
jgi:hypothetical protein